MDSIPKIIVFLIIAGVLLFAFCRDGEDKDVKDAYDRVYKEAYSKEIGRQQDKGVEDGNAAANEDASTGSAWKLYQSLAVNTLIAAFLLGLSIQYGLLLYCRRSGGLSHFSTAGPVPAISTTAAYRSFELWRETMIELEERLWKSEAFRHLQSHQAKQIKETLALKVKRLSTIQELGLSRFLELAAEEFEMITGSSLKDTPREIGDGNSRTGLDHMCPDCRTVVRQDIDSANKTLTCPNRECGRSIKLLPAPTDADDDQPILEI